MKEEVHRRMDMSRWRERLNEFDEEHRIMLEGGSISQLFLGFPLSYSHPVFIGFIYALIINLILISTNIYDGYINSEDFSEIFEQWFIESLMILFTCAILGGFSSMMSSIFKRPPVRLEKRRRYLYPIPFIGLLVTMIAITFSTPMELEFIGYSLIILPGPLYIQLSYAPRWRMLERIDRDLDPFEGMNKTIEPQNYSDKTTDKNNEDLENIIEELY
tara:strand:- start:2132 stop:2782 length:651 start_codon:yes stop_codon:yes gene_type:complete